MFQSLVFILNFAFSASVFAQPIACVLSAADANLVERSYKVRASGFGDRILAPETVSIRAQQLSDDFKIRIYPHYEMNYTPQVVEFRVPKKFLSARSGGGIEQPTFRLVASSYENGLYKETRVTNKSKADWEEDQFGYIFEYRVVMKSPTEVDSVSFIVSDKNGNILESSTWEIEDAQILN